MTPGNRVLVPYVDKETVCVFTYISYAGAVSLSRACVCVCLCACMYVCMYVRRPLSLCLSVCKPHTVLNGAPEAACKHACHIYLITRRCSIYIISHAVSTSYHTYISYHPQVQYLETIHDQVEPQKLQHLWEAVVSKHSSKAAIWRAYLQHRKAHFSSFSVPAVRAAYATALKSLQVPVCTIHTRACIVCMYTHSFSLSFSLTHFHTHTHTRTHARAHAHNSRIHAGLAGQSSGGAGGAGVGARHVVAARGPLPAVRARCRARAAGVRRARVAPQAPPRQEELRRPH